MACDSATLLSNAAANGLYDLDNRSLLLAICGSLSANLGNRTASDALAAGAAFQAYDDRQLDEAIAAYLCSLLP